MSLVVGRNPGFVTLLLPVLVGFFSGIDPVILNLSPPGLLPPVEPYVFPEVELLSTRWRGLFAALVNRCEPW
jgi:hypothetical protein